MITKLIGGVTYKAVSVFGAGAASSTFPVTAVAHIRPEAASITLLCTHRPRHCGRETETMGGQITGSAGP